MGQLRLHCTIFILFCHQICISAFIHPIPRAHFTSTNGKSCVRAPRVNNAPEPQGILIYSDEEGFPDPKSSPISDRVSQTLGANLVEGSSDLSGTSPRRWVLWRNLAFLAADIEQLQSNRKVASRTKVSDAALCSADVVVLVAGCRESSTDSLARLTLPDLKAICRKRGLRVSGRKMELIERLTVSNDTDVSFVAIENFANYLGDKVEAEIITVDGKRGSDSAIACIEALLDDENDEDNGNVDHDIEYIEREEVEDEHADESSNHIHSTESLLTALQVCGTASFGDIMLSKTLQANLQTRGFSEPTPIQKASFGEEKKSANSNGLVNGESAIIHAETGSGKTLAFLLPLIQRMLVHHGFANAETLEDASGSVSYPAPCSIVVVVPTQELADQTFREVKKILPGCDKNQICQGLVSPVPLASLLSPESKDCSIKSAIVIGTVKQVTQMLVATSTARETHDKIMRDSKSTPPSAQTESKMYYRLKLPIGALVLDEVDRMLLVPGKYATRQIKERRERHPRPALKLMQAAFATEFGFQKDGTRLTSSTMPFQLIACSATVGRNLRRKIGRIISESSNDTRNVKDAIRVICSSSDPANSNAEQQQRAVVVPASIEHSYIACRGPRDMDVSAAQKHGNLITKMDALILALALRGRPTAPMVFIPDGASVDNAVRYLRQNGVQGEVVALHRLSLAQINCLSNTKVQNAKSIPMLPLIVATESSARGLDFPVVDAVFILARPRSADEYLHLAGRTGRSGKPGLAVSIVTYREAAALEGWAVQLRFALGRLKEIEG